MKNDIIASVKVTKETLSKYNLTIKKKYGQNFLIDTNIIEKIILKAQISKDTYVIEIGPGIGALTQYLASKAKQVICFEIDRQLEPVLKDTLGSYDNVKVLYEDFLQTDLEKIIETYCQGAKEIIVVANLPYYITTPILIKIFESKTKITRICTMMQKEVGLRLSASPSTKDYNSLSILTQYYTDAKIVINVPATVFIPKPKVDSVVVLFEVRHNKYYVSDEQFFFKLLRVMFKQRRKTLLNNLNSLYDNKVRVQAILKQANLESNVRAESLSIQEIINLCEILINEGDIHDKEKLCKNKFCD